MRRLFLLIVAVYEPFADWLRLHRKSCSEHRAPIVQVRSILSNRSNDVESVVMKVNDTA